MATTNVSINGNYTWEEILVGPQENVFVSAEAFYQYAVSDSGAPAPNFKGHYIGTEGGIPGISIGTLTAGEILYVNSLFPTTFVITS